MTKREMIEIASRNASLIFMKDGELLPIWECHARDGEVFVIGTPWGDTDEKDKVSEAMRAIFKKRDVTSYVYICEAWFRFFSQDEGGLDRAWKQGLSEDPQRCEALVFTAEDETGQLMAHRVIERDANGKPSLKPLEFQDTVSQSEGRFVGMLPARGKLQ
jgi:hypothetical protein